MKSTNFSTVNMYSFEKKMEKLKDKSIQRVNNDLENDIKYLLYLNFVQLVLPNKK